MKKLSLAIVLGAVMLSGAAQAKPWETDYAHSHLGFEGKQGSAAFQGEFKKFTVDIDFDQAKPETGKIDATIDTASASAGNAERDSNLPQPDWFDVKKFPRAQFASTAIHAKDGGCYEAAGSLTIKGVTKPLTLPFCLTKEGDHFRAKGKVGLVRTDYNVGAGGWANEENVKFAVDVTVDMAVKPKG